MPIESDDGVVLIYATAPDESSANAIAEALLEARLIACANIVPQMTSLYRWEGRIAREREAVLILKTRGSLAAQAIAAGRALHPYETPAFIVLDAKGGFGPFLDWVRSDTAPPAE